MNTVLVVEDEKPIKLMLDMLLQNAGFNKILVGDAENACRQIQYKAPDIILMDWMLPDISGLELTRRLKQEDHTQHIPIIMLTARVSEYDKITSLEAGADDYIEKPFSPIQLVERIHQLL